MVTEGKEHRRGDGVAVTEKRGGSADVAGQSPVTGMPRPNFSFADGVLHIEIPRAKMRFQWHPEPKAEEFAVGSRRWKPFWPDFRLIVPERPAEGLAGHTVDIRINESDPAAVEQKAEALTQFKQALPDEIVQIAGPFGSHQWALMTFMHEDEWAMDLARGNPVLAYALANNSQFRGTSPDIAAVQARWHCHRKQRALLEWLGFPGTDKVARLLRKVPPEVVTPITLHRLAHALTSDERVLGLLSHVPRITSTVLDLATTLKYLDLITPTLLKEVAERPEPEGGTAVGDLILEGLVFMEKIRPMPALAPLTRLAQVVRFREEAEAAHNMYQECQEAFRRAAAARRARLRREEQARMREQERLREARNDALGLPPPPFPGTRSIVPLTSAKQMREESEEQQHCVKAYTDHVLRGGLYIYKILAPERATLAIKKGANGWCKSELKAAYNRRVSQATVRAVDIWLAEVSGTSPVGKG